MHSDLVDIGWTETQWNRILQTVTEEAQRARVTAQVLPLSGPDDPSTIAVPSFTLNPQNDPYPFSPAPAPGAQRLAVDSDPTLFYTTIGVNVHLRTYEAADPELKAALTQFRRAASYIARIEDALVLSGRAGPNTPPAQGIGGIPLVYTVTGNGAPQGIFGVPRLGAPLVPGTTGAALNGDDVFRAIVQATGLLEANGNFGPFACVLSQNLFTLVCTPVPPNSILPRDRILPFLQGPLVRSSAVPPGNAQQDQGAVIALAGAPVEILVASDISVRFLQTTLEPRLVFRVCERVALRLKEPLAIAILS